MRVHPRLPRQDGQPGGARGNRQSAQPGRLSRGEKERRCPEQRDEAEREALLLDGARGRCEQRGEREQTPIALRQPAAERERRRDPEAGDGHVRVRRQRLELEALRREHQASPAARSSGCVRGLSSAQSVPLKAASSTTNCTWITRVSARPHEMEVECLEGRQTQRVLERRIAVAGAGEHRVVERAGQAAPVAEQHLRLQRPVGEGVEVGQRPHGTLRGQEREHGCEAGGGDSAASRRRGAGGPPPSSLPVHADCEQGGRRGDDERRRRGKPGVEQRRHRGDERRESAEERRQKPLPARQPVPDSGNQQERRCQHGEHGIREQQAGERADHRRTSQSRPKRQAARGRSAATERGRASSTIVQASESVTHCHARRQVGECPRRRVHERACRPLALPRAKRPCAIRP